MLAGSNPTLQRTLQGDFLIKLSPPCDQRDEACYIKFGVDVNQSVAAILTGFFIGGLTLYISSAVLWNKPNRTLGVLRGKKLRIRQEIDENELATTTSSYESLETTASFLYLPLALHYNLPPTRDSSSVEIRSLRVVRDEASDPAIKLEPRFSNEKHRVIYDGSVEFSPGQKGPVSFTLEYKVANNMSLTAERFRNRWGEDDTRDDFTFSSMASWDELEIQFVWPKDKLKIEGKPWVTMRLVAGDQEQLVQQQWDAKTWTLLAKNVPAGQEYIFHWNLA